MRTTKILQAAVGVALAIGVQQAAQAATFNYSFDILTSPTSCISPAYCGAGAPPWGSLSFSDTGTNQVQMIFSMQNIPDPLPNSTWDKHLFWNYAGGPNLTGGSFTAVANTAANQLLYGATSLISGPVATGSFTNVNQGTYDFDIEFGGSALNPGEKAVYNITGTGLTASMFNAYSSGSGNHYIAGLELINTNGANKFDVRVAAIPEPETYAMMLAGLGLMGFVARRRKQNGA